MNAREFVNWWRDQHQIDGCKMGYVMTDKQRVIDLDAMTDEEAEWVAAQFMLMSTPRGSA